MCSLKRIISWNLNGLMPKVRSGQLEAALAFDPDFVCCQEIRTSATPQLSDKHLSYFNPSARGGYSGTLLMSKEEPIEVTFGLGRGSGDPEGRSITAEYDTFFLVNVYVPNSQRNLDRLSYRIVWDNELLAHLVALMEIKPVIVCGDFNVAIHDSDIYSESRHFGKENDGFITEERSDIEGLLDLGFVDAFRLKHPSEKGAFTWWSKRKNRKAVNHGWRLDYFFVTDDLAPYVVDVKHHHEIEGSDHCPIELDIFL